MAFQPFRLGPILQSHLQSKKSIIDTKIYNTLHFEYQQILLVREYNQGLGLHFTSNSRTTLPMNHYESLMGCVPHAERQAQSYRECGFAPCIASWSAVVLDVSRVHDSLIRMTTFATKACPLGYQHLPIWPSACRHGSEAKRTSTACHHFCCLWKNFGDDSRPTPHWTEALPGRQLHWVSRGLKSC